MKAFLVSLLGIAKIIANWLFSSQGRTVLQWSGKAVTWVHEAAADESLSKADKFKKVAERVTYELLYAGVVQAGSVPQGMVTKIVEIAHGAWQEEQRKLEEAGK